MMILPIGRSKKAARVKGQEKLGPSFLRKERAFTMVELMVTVVIVSVCLIMALRVFSICAGAVSEAYNRSLAVNLLQEKIDEIQEKAVMENGVNIEEGSSEEKVVVNSRKLTFVQEFEIWTVAPTSAEGEEAQDEEEGRRLGIVEQEEEIEEGEEEEEKTDLCTVELRAAWKTLSRTKGLILRTLMPIAGSRDEF